MQPYTYLIGWSKLDRWYYGVRTKQGCHPSELWNGYFTSSKHVREFVQKNGEPDVIEIRQMFETKESAMSWESKVLRRMGVSKSIRWLNRHVHGGKFCNIHPHSAETKAKLEKAGKAYAENNPWSEEKKARHAEQCKSNWPNYAEKHRQSKQNLVWISSPDGSKSRHVKNYSSEYTSLMDQGWTLGRKAFKPSNKIDNKPPKIYKTKEEISEINRQSQLGLKKSAAAVEKTAEKNRKSYCITHPCGNEELVHGLARFCRDHGLTCSLMVRVANGQQTHHKGYKIKRT